MGAPREPIRRRQKSDPVETEPLYVTTDAEALEVPVVLAGVEALEDVEV